MVTPIYKIHIIVSVFFIISNGVPANGSEIPNLFECSSVVTNPTPGNSLYSQSEIFGATATPKDVEALKYYCLNDLIRTIITKEMVSIYILIAV